MATVDFVLLKKAAIAAFFRFKFRFRQALYSPPVSSNFKAVPQTTGRTIRQGQKPKRWLAL